MSHQTGKDKKLKANVKRDKQAAFSTDVLVNHSPTEFRMTFFDTWATRKTPSGGIQQRKDVVAEVVLTPEHFKRLCKAINDNLQKYESRFGDISFSKADTQGPEQSMGETESSAYR